MFRIETRTTRGGKCNLTNVYGVNIQKEKVPSRIFIPVVKGTPKILRQSQLLV